MNLVGSLVAAVAPSLADLGVQRGPGRSLAVPGERGDSILISLQSVPSGVPDRAELMVNVSNHLLPWTAYLRDVSLDEARAKPPEYAESVYHARLPWPSSGYLPEIWTVTPDTLAAVADDLSTELRRALTTVWLPLLPRAELRAQIRDKERKGPSYLRDRPTTDLLCRIEDLSEGDLRDLVRYFRSRTEDDPDLGRLAHWIGQTFLTDQASI